MSLHLCDHCHKHRAAVRLEMSYPTPYPECVCPKCLRHVDGRQITSQGALEMIPEVRIAEFARTTAMTGA